MRSDRFPFGLPDPFHRAAVRAMRAAHAGRWSLFVIAVAGIGCDRLASRNVTEPDIDRVYSTASAIEETIGTRLQTCHNARGAAWTHMNMLAQDATASVTSGATIPREAIGSVTSPFNDYRDFAANGRIAANLVTALDRLTSRGGTLGTDAQNLRARSFGFFAVGCHLGWLALVYDSAAITLPGIPGDSVPPFSGAGEVMQAAIAMLDSAITIASGQAALGGGGFPLPASWAGGNTLTRDDFVRLVRSFRARFRAGVARTKGERDGVDWTAVIDDARNGVTADFMITGGTSTGWINSRGVVGSVSLPPMYYGMADVSGAYEGWLALPPTARAAFVIVTPDRRWPQGATRAAQQASAATAGTSFTATPYLVNLTDTQLGFAVTPWGASYYQFRRLQYMASAATVGLVPVVTKAEMDLLAAEGLLRQGDIAAATVLIDVTRVGRGQLPAVSGAITSLEQPVPGGATCVPRVPSPPAFTSTACGTIWEALKWEKRMETAVVGYGTWFTDSRGWGDLVTGTPLELPVPYQELSARHKPYYSLGGGSKSTAPKGTYGF